MNEKEKQKQFKTYKNECIKLLFAFFDKRPLKAEIKNLEYNETNFEKILNIKNSLYSVHNRKNNKFIYDVVSSTLNAKKVDRFYKLFECENFINYKPYTKDIRPSALMAIDTEWISDEKFDIFLELINNKMFLECADDSKVIKQMILDIFYKIENKKSSKIYHDIITNPKFWTDYNDMEKYKIITQFDMNSNNIKQSELIMELTKKLYFKRRYTDICESIIKSTKNINKRNIDGIIELIKNVDNEFAKENYQKISKIINKIKQAKSSKQAIEIANIASNSTILENDIDYINSVLRKMETNAKISELKEELKLLKNMKDNSTHNNVINIKIIKK